MNRDVRAVRDLLAHTDPSVDTTAAWADPRGQAALQSILAAPARQSGEPGGVHERARSRRPLALVAGFVAVLVVFAVVASVMRFRPNRPPAPPDLQLVAFTQDHGSIVARITDPLAAANQLDAVFRAHQLNIRVLVVPVSPSLVGTVVYSDFNAQPLTAGSCATGGGAVCQIGFLIPAGFTGPGDVTVGRPAKGNETYASSAQVFGPGEILHCSGLQGQLATAVLPTLQSLGLSAQWMGEVSRHGSAPHEYITGGVALSPKTVLLQVSPNVPTSSQYAQALATDDRGC